MTLPKILRVVWGQQEGYVCLSTLKRPDKHTWKDHIFKWPQDKIRIRRCIERYQDDHEIYWAPMVFNKDSRKEQYSTDCSYLWADLDPVAPSKCFIEPSIAWESSPGRYQAIWLLKDAIDPADHNELNKRLTYAVGADKSGWDLTQVLRLPGTTNHKYVEKPPVKLMWMRQQFYDAQDLAGRIPSINRLGNDLIEIESLDGDFDELREIIWPYRKVIGNKLWELLFTPDSMIDEGERSDRLWELECRLLESNVPVSDVVRIAKACPWNKYKGRRDEDKRILLEVLKAEKNIRVSPLVVPSEALKIPFVSYSHFMGRQLSGQGWMIEGVWGNNSHGMIAGEPKTYKSIIATEMAVSVASGEAMWGQFKVHRTGPVLFIQEENPPWVVQDRLIKVVHGKDLLKGKVYQADKSSGKYYIQFPPELPIRLVNNWGFNLTLEEHRAELVREIERVKPVLLILDPLYLMLGNTDENSAQSLREVLTWLLELKMEYGMAIVILHHWNKGGREASGRGGQRMLGSTTLHAWVDSALYTSIREVEDNEVTIEREFRSFVKPENLVMGVEMSEPGKDPSYEVVIRKASEIKKTKGTTVDLLRYIEVHGTAEIGELCASVGFSSTGVKKIMSRFQDQGFVEYEKGSRGRGISSCFTLTGAGREWLATNPEGEVEEGKG